MTTLAAQLDGVLSRYKEVAPAPVQETIKTVRAELDSFDTSKALQVGDKLPSFTLPNALGGTTSSDELLKENHLLISFYRGSWCPFCNLALRALQQNLEKFHAKGVELVAISPQLPDSSLSTKEKNELEFPVLSDVGHKYARELGIVWQQPASLRPIFDGFGHDLKKTNGDDTFELPLPAVFLVGKDGIVKGAYVEPDYTKRLEPATALEWAEKL